MRWRTSSCIEPRDTGFLPLTCVIAAGSMTCDVSSLNDMRILGIPMWPAPLSDEEYVARIRKGLRIAGWLRWFNSAMGLALVGVSVWGLTVFADILSDSGARQDQPQLFAAFGLSILLGTIVGLWFAQAGHAIGNAFFGQRRNRLLVECWDALHKERKG